MQDSNNSALTLKQFEGEDGIEILIDTSTGESFCSVSGYARMAGKAQSTISDRLPIGEDGNNIGQTRTAAGLRSIRLITEDQIVEWLPKDNPIAATQLLKMGVRMTLHKMAGYSVSSTAVNPEPDRFAEMRERAELAIALAGGTGEPAVAAYKSLFHGVQEPKRSPGRPKKTPEPEPAPVAEMVENPIVQPNAILTDFLVKLNDLVQRDIVTDCAFTKVTKAYKPYLAVHLPTVWLLMVEHFAMQYDRVSLENAIISCHGSRRTLQRFVPKTGGEKKTQQRHCALIPMKSIDATSTARMLLESTIMADTAIPSSATQNAPMTP